MHLFIIIRYGKLLGQLITPNLLTLFISWNDGAFILIESIA